MEVTITNISDELLILKSPVSLGDFAVSQWDKTALLTGETATADLTLQSGYSGGAIEFDHNLDPTAFILSVAFNASDLIRVKDAGDTIIIPNGDNTPNPADGTDFGSTNVNTTVSKTYIVENVGILPVALSITVPSGYTLTNSPSGAVLPGEQTSFTVRFDALASGDDPGIISIAPGAADEYTFSITAHGNFYYEKDRTGLTAYLFLNELAGSVANDDSPENNDGAYSNVTLNNTDSPIPGDRAPLFNGLSGAGASRVNLYSVGMAADFNPLEGTIFVWAKVANAGIWIDGLVRYVIRLAVDATNNNSVRIVKATPANLLAIEYGAGGTLETRLITISTTDWFSAAITWSKSNDRVRAYLNGVQQGADMTALGVWAGSLSPTRCVLGALDTNGFNGWSGWESHYRNYPSELPAADIFALNTIP
jgi:hypothetical protein